MKANCDNPSCKSIVDTNKIHIIRYDKVTDTSAQKTAILYTNTFSIRTKDTIFIKLPTYGRNK